MSLFNLDEYVHEALRAGASGFLLKDARPEQLVDAVRQTCDGESLFAPVILSRLVEHYVRAPRTTADGDRASALERLTTRETEVLTLVARGCRTPRSPRR
ncbi:hypothetical protein [Corynebacterium sp.]|uniref:hypothetical protein n=1 Tax=Corynebacterium sp. TaxID=1720 RepID=UPI003B3B7A3E